MTNFKITLEPFGDETNRFFVHEFWDCVCPDDEKFIHHKSEQFCKKCNYDQEEGTKSMLHEIIEKQPEIFTQCRN